MGAILHSPYGQTILGIAPVSIGKARGNQLIVNDASAEAHHAEIRPSGNVYSIVDLGSSSGTFVNKQRLYTNIPQALQNGDIIRLGHTQFTYEVTNRAPIAPTVYASPSSPTDADYAATVLAPGGSTQPPLAYAPPPPPSASDPYASSPSTPLAAPPPPLATSSGTNSALSFDPYAPPPSKPIAKGRPVGVSIIAFLMWIGAADAILLIFLQTHAGGIITPLGIIFGAAGGYIGWGLWSLKQWSYRASVILQILGILLALYAFSINSSAGALVFALVLRGVTLIYLVTSSKVRKAFRPIP